jgi:dipeptidyl aminopeptidase/acylaminoacyl peptidase
MFEALIAPLAALMLQAVQPNDPAILFGRREEVEQASLSPDGTKLAFLGPLPGQGSALVIVSLGADPRPTPILVADGNPERLERCRWAANDRLVCSVYAITQLENGDFAYVTRYVAIDSDGKNRRMLLQGRTGTQIGYTLFGGGIIDWLPDEDGNVMMTRDYVPEQQVGTRLAQDKDGFGVDRVNTRSGTFSTVENPRRDAAEYISDGRGKVRIMGARVTEGATGYSTGQTRYYYRKKGSREWEDLSVVDEEGGFDPHGVDSELDVAYGIKKLDGRRAAFKVSLDGSMKETKVYAHPQVDVDGFLRIGRRGRIVGVSYTTDRNEAHFFDPELDRLAKSLSRAIPNAPLIRFVDSSVDESKLLIWAGSDMDPGRYYLFSKATKELNELVSNRPDVTAMTVAAMKPVTYPAADGTKIPGYLTLPPGKETAKGLPAIVLPHGGPHARDEWGFDWLSQYFAQRGYAVLQPNFRGSAGYGEQWFQNNGFQSWRTAIGDVNDGGRWLVAQGIADPKKLAIFGWSYGGYAALQSAVIEPGLFGAVVAVAPVTDLDLLKEQWRDWTNYRVMARFIGSGPHIDEASPARHANKIKVPVLMFHGTYDRNVHVRHARVMEARLKSVGVPAELVTYDRLDHYLENSQVRGEMLAKSDAFIRKSLGL